MLTIERHTLILKLLNEKKNIKLKEIISKLNISEATARRDLVELESSGELVRVHGGAVLSSAREPDMTTKCKLNIEAKKKIAEKASMYINDGDTIFLDAGTTCGFLIKYLKEKKIIVITNGISHISELLNFNIPTYLIGGKIKSKTSAVVGFDAVESLKKYNFNKVFIGANAMGKNGYSTPDQEEAILKRAAILNSDSVYILCDSSKHGTQSLINFASLEEGVLIDEL